MMHPQYVGVDCGVDSMRERVDSPEESTPLKTEVYGWIPGWI
jgi:hypothetical protein